MSQLAPLKTVEPVWVTDFWDGPLNGLALYEGRCHWFEVESFDPDHPPEIRKYILYPLTDDEIVAEEALHDLFRKHVGTHTDWDVRGTPDAVVRPQTEHAAFYDSAEAQRDRDYTTRPAIGWFRLS